MQIASSFYQLTGLMLICIGLHSVGYAQEEGASTEAPPATTEENELVESLPESVTVSESETAQDEDISNRLLQIIEATGWFSGTDVLVENGVVFLEGEADSDKHLEWVTQLARRTEDVVAVVNNMTIAPQPLWDLSPAWKELHEMARGAIVNLPLIAVAALMLLITMYVVRLAYRISQPRYEKQFNSRLLSDVAARVTAGLILVIGIYFVLRISGLTRLAVTILGGTGLLGIVFGFAFRDIAENFLASILISLQRPFRLDDLIEVDGIKGFVRSVTTRGTMLQTFSGNHVHISNSTIYKSRLTNFSSNPSSRDDFLIGIGYDAPVSRAQEIIYEEIKEHQAVLLEPSPLVLVDNLGASTVNLKVYVWIDTAKHSLIKVRSALLRRLVLALEEGGISMPDEAREVIFPQGLDVRNHRIAIDAKVQSSGKTSPPPSAKKQADDAQTNASEGDLTQEKDELDRQHQQTDQPESGTQLI